MLSGNCRAGGALTGPGGRGSWLGGGGSALGAERVASRGTVPGCFTEQMQPPW